MKKNIDFFVIGAAKGGTTALFQFIENHDQIYVPKGKEIPFFDVNSVYSKGFSWYKDNILSKAPNDTISGTITPQYMLGSHDVDVPTIAQRMKNDCPDAKLVAVLRDPIARTFSHYKMMRRHGYENRDFATAMQDTIRRRKNITSLERIDEPLLGSEYGRILQEFHKHFDKKQILVFFAEDLRKNPQDVVDKFCKFIGVESRKMDQTQSTEVHQGGVEPKFRLLTPNVLNNLPFANGLKKIIPYKLQKRMNFAINTWNIKPDQEKLDKQSEIYTQLVDYFRPDVQLLEKLIDKPTPWSEFH